MQRGCHTKYRFPTKCNNEGMHLLACIRGISRRMSAPEGTHRKTLPAMLTPRADVTNSGSTAEFWMRLSAMVRLECPWAWHGICSESVKQPTTTPPKIASTVLFAITRPSVNAPSLRPGIDGLACKMIARHQAPDPPAHAPYSGSTGCYSLNHDVQ